MRLQPISSGYEPAEQLIAEESVGDAGGGGGVGGAEGGGGVGDGGRQAEGAFQSGGARVLDSPTSFMHSHADWQ